MTTELFSQSNERYILKTMRNRPDHIVEIAQKLLPQDFYLAPYRLLFVAMKKLSVKGDITSEGILSLLESENKEGYRTLIDLGGQSAIDAELLDFDFPKNPSIQSHIDILKSLSYRRQAVRIGETISHAASSNIDQDANKQFENIDELDDKIKEMTYSLSDNLNDTDDIKQIGESVAEVKQMIAEREIKGIDISFIMPKFNRMVKGLRNGALYVIGAPEKVGKSSVMLHISWSIADKLGIPIAFADTEMQTSELLLRICSKISQVSEDAITNDELSDSQREKVDAAWDRIEEVPFFHFNANELTNNELESKVKLLQLKEGVQLLVYDYVKIQSHEVEKGRLDMMLAAKLDTLKEKIAKNCQIPVITSGQMYKLDHQNKAHKFAETSHFTKLGDVIVRLDRTDNEDPTAFGTHYLELITGRKVNQRDVGKKIELNMNMTNHQVEELG